jgi:hypothetical protein
MKRMSLQKEIFITSQSLGNTAKSLPNTRIESLCQSPQEESTNFDMIPHGKIIFRNREVRQSTKRLIIVSPVLAPTSSFSFLEFRFVEKR